VAAAESAGVPLHRFPLDSMRAIEPRIEPEALAFLTAERSVRSRTSYGGTAPANVRREARKWLKKLEKERA
jgi:argininosuccinate lyase